MRLVPRKVNGGVSTAINIGGTLGSTGSGLYGSANGKLSLDLRVTFKYEQGGKPYFDLSLSPDLRITFEAGVKGSFSNNFLSNILSTRYDKHLNLFLVSLYISKNLDFLCLVEEKIFKSLALFKIICASILLFKSFLLISFLGGECDIVRLLLLLILLLAVELLLELELSLV